MMKSILFLLLSTSAYASNYFPTEAEFLNESAHLIQVSSSYFSSKVYYDDQGVLTAMTSGDNFTLIDTNLKISYGISNQLQAALSARVRRVSSISGTYSLYKTGPESGAAFLKYSFPVTGNLKTAIGVRYRQTLYTATKYDVPQVAAPDEIVLGDDGSEYALDLFSTYHMGALKFIGNLSYQSPANNLSPEINYKLEGQYEFTHLVLLVGVDGIFSLKKDPYTMDTKPRISRGSTHLFNSINREIISAYAGMNYSFKKFAMGISGQGVIKGVSTDVGNTIALNFSTGTEGVTPESIKLKTFKEYQIDSSVLKISSKGNLVRIDQGISNDVEKGMKFDIYQTDYFGGNVLVASGIVIDVGSDWSTIKLLKKFKQIEIKPGFAARGY